MPSRLFWGRVVTGDPSTGDFAVIFHDAHLHRDGVTLTGTARRYEWYLSYQDEEAGGDERWHYEGSGRFKLTRQVVG